nr:zinc finger BED domain-containing protein RICESLEEPER 2-like [Tanacetum cinerariifolium]
MYFHDLLASKGRCVYFSTENWVTIESLTQLLEVFNNATKILSRVYYPTSPLILQQIFFMITKLSEYELEEDFVTHLQTTEFETFDFLGFWKAKETMFPVLSRMAIDILSVQATSVASESAFSTSERVLSIRKTRPTSASLEMYFEEEILDDEVQANKAIPLSNKEIAIDAASSEGSMSGPGLGGEEAEADYGYDVYHDDY